jgi:hypothetical protein
MLAFAGPVNNGAVLHQDNIGGPSEVDPLTFW